MKLTIPVKILRIFILIQAIICLMMIPVMYLASAVIAMILPEVLQKVTIILPMIFILLSLFHIVLFVKIKQQERWAFIVVYVLLILFVFLSFLNIYYKNYGSGIFTIGFCGYYIYYFTFGKKGKLFFKKGGNLNNENEDEEEDDDEDEVIISQNELNSKLYIQKYKSKYSKDEIKKGLIEIGLSEQKVEKYLNRYF